MTNCSSLRAVPVGFFWPTSHFCTVDRLVFNRRAKTPWLAREDSRMRLICAGGKGSWGHCLASNGPSNLALRSIFVFEATP